MVIGNHAGRVHGNIDVGHLAMAYLTQGKSLLRERLEACHADRALLSLVVRLNPLFLQLDEHQRFK